MKKTILSMLMVAIFTIASSCSSSISDEPESKGSWRMMFIEVFRSTHTDNSDFKVWFDNNLDYLKEARFIVADDNNNNDFVYPAYAEVESYYDKSWIGILVWWVDLHNKSESEIRQMADQFEAFTIFYDDTRYDRFTAEYAPLDNLDNNEVTH